MKKLTLLLILTCFLSSCGVTRIPQKEIITTHVVDSIAWHDSTIITYLEKERYVDITKPLDTLKLETSYAKAEAYLDTINNVLRGNIENKTDIPVKTQIKWKEKIVYRDSIRTVEKEVPVEVIKEIKVYPKIFWVFAAISIITVLYVILRAYLKFKKI